MLFGYGNMGVFSNSIGTNQQGNQALANYEGVIVGNVLSGAANVGAVGQDELNTPISMSNLISGNLHLGLNIGTADSSGAGYFSPVSIEGNRIGTDASATFAVPNGLQGDNAFASGILISRGFTEPTVVGGTNPLSRNIISGNAGDGIFSGPSKGGSGYPTPTTIANNLIGLNSSLNPLGNGANGIEIGGGSGLQIGGTDQVANQIAYNGTQIASAAGVLIDGYGGTYGAAQGITVRNNSIHHNAGLGIDLSSSFVNNNGGGDGITTNDTCDQDADVGANLLQNFPELTAPVFNADDTATVAGILRSSGHQHFTIDLYANSNAEPFNHGEGETSIGSVGVTTDGNGFASFTFTSAVTVSSSAGISATATDDFGNTSEFSCNAGTTCSDSGPHTLKDALASPQDVCPAAIVVNVTGDEEDANINDGLCDVDPTTTACNAHFEPQSWRHSTSLATSGSYFTSRAPEFRLSRRKRRFQP